MEDFYFMFRFCEYVIDQQETWKFDFYKRTDLLNDIDANVQLHVKKLK